VSADPAATLRALTDDELVVRVRDLASHERGALAVLIEHLAELDTREAPLRAGYGSLFAYCVEELGWSEQDAFLRIAAARAARRFPVVLEMLDAGSVNVSTLRLLGPHLTLENHRAVLESARGKKKAQVEEILAGLNPLPDAPTIVRKLPAPRTTVLMPERSWTSAGAGRAVEGPGRPIAPGPAREPPPADTELAPAPTSSPWAPMAPNYTARDTPAPSLPPSGPPAPPGPSGPARPAEVTPLSPDRYRVQVTIGGDTLEKLRFAKDLLRHAVPSGDEAAILDRALTALLTDIAQRKFAATERPRSPGPPTPGSRHVPADVKRTVWLRDLGRCAYAAPNGRRCTERAFLEFHHVHPYAAGGEPTAENIQLRCRAHNGYESRLFFGEAHDESAGGDARGGSG
jgi:hypothetical protein